MPQQARPVHRIYQARGRAVLLPGRARWCSAAEPALLDSTETNEL